MFPTIPPPSQRLLVFARVPELGRVKTRLAKTIGEPLTLAVYQAMIRDLLRSIGESSPDMAIEIMWAPTETANGETLREAFGNLPAAMQTGNTLGDRIAMAFSERFFFHRTETIIAIGVDDPLLTRETLEHAFGLLRACDWVLGPAADGGYYLIGCRAPAFDSSVFRDIEWGSDRVFATTRERIRASETTLAVLPMRHDIDTEEDLRRFADANHEGELASLLRAS